MPDRVPRHPRAARLDAAPAPRSPLQPAGPDGAGPAPETTGPAPSGRHSATDGRPREARGEVTDDVADEATVEDPRPAAPGRRARHRPARSSALPPLRGSVLWPLAALVAVGLVGASTLRGRPLPDDARLTGPASELLMGGGDLAPLSPDAVGAVHAAVYATVTRSFERHATLAGAGRELMLVALLVSALLVWRTTRRLGAGDAAAALAVLAFGAVPWLAPAHTAGGPAALAACWLLLAAWLLAPGRPSPAAGVVAAVATVLAVLLTPDALVLLIAGLAAAAGTGRLRAVPSGWQWPAAAGLAAAAVGARVVLGRWDPHDADPGRWAATTPGLVAVGVVVLGVGLLTALRSPRLRPVGIALAATTVLAVLPPSGRLPALLLCLPAAAVLLGVLVDALLSRQSSPVTATRRQDRGRPAWGLAAVVAAALAVALVGGVVTLRTVPRSDFGAATAARLGEWARTQLPDGARLSVPAHLRAELVHAGTDPARLGSSAAPREAATTAEETVLRVVSGEAPAGSAPVVRMDAADGLAPLTVVDPTPVAPTPEERERRRVLGQALAANPTTVASDEVRTQLAGGELDPRLMSLLAGIGAASGIGLQSLPLVPGEEGRTLVRQAVVTSVGGVGLEGNPVQTDRVLTLLRAQRPPYTPDVVRPVDGGLLVGYRYVPGPDAVLTRAGVG